MHHHPQRKIIVPDGDMNGWCYHQPGDRQGRFVDIVADIVFFEDRGDDGLELFVEITYQKKVPWLLCHIAKELSHIGLRKILCAFGYVVEI